MTRDSFRTLGTRNVKVLRLTEGVPYMSKSCGQPNPLTEFSLWRVRCSDFLNQVLTLQIWNLQPMSSSSFSAKNPASSTPPLQPIALAKHPPLPGGIPTGWGHETGWWWDECRWMLSCRTDAARFMVGDITSALLAAWPMTNDFRCNRRFLGSTYIIKVVSYISTKMSIYVT